MSLWVGTLDKIHPEQNASGTQGTAKTRIEHCNKNFRRKSGISEPYTAAHHECHNEIGFQVEKVPDGSCFLGIGAYPFRMPDAHSVEHKPEYTEHNGRQQYVDCRDLIKTDIRQHPKACNVESCCKPYAPAIASSARFFTW